MGVSDLHEDKVREYREAGWMVGGVSAFLRAYQAAGAHTKRFHGETEELGQSCFNEIQDQGISSPRGIAKAFSEKTNISFKRFLIIMESPIIGRLAVNPDAWRFSKESPDEKLNGPTLEIMEVQLSHKVPRWKLAYYGAMSDEFVSRCNLDIEVYEESLTSGQMSRHDLIRAHSLDLDFQHNPNRERRSHWDWWKEYGDHLRSGNRWYP